MNVDKKEQAAHLLVSDLEERYGQSTLSLSELAVFLKEYFDRYPDDFLSIVELVGAWIDEGHCLETLNSGARQLISQNMLLVMYTHPMRDIMQESFSPVTSSSSGFFSSSLKNARSFDDGTSKKDGLDAFSTKF